MSERVVLTASEGMVYTDGEFYGQEIILSSKDNPDNWREVPESEMYAAMSRES